MTFFLACIKHEAMPFPQVTLVHKTPYRDPITHIYLCTLAFSSTDYLLSYLVPSHHDIRKLELLIKNQVLIAVW